jgi:hypothetical protein
MDCGFRRNDTLKQKWIAVALCVCARCNDTGSIVAIVKTKNELMQSAVLLVRKPSPRCHCGGRKRIARRNPFLL